MKFSPHRSSVIELSLSSDAGFCKNVLGDKGGEALMVALPLAPKLTSLSIGNVGVLGLAAATFGSAAHVAQLDLRQNHIGDELIAEILSPLHQSQALTSLCLNRNCLSDASTSQLLGLISSCRFLRHIDLSHNQLGRNFALGMQSRVC